MKELKEKTETRAAFLLALKNGLGLTRGCKLLGLDVVKVSKFLKEDRVFLADCNMAVNYAGKVLIAEASKSLGKKDFVKWNQAVQKAQSFVPELVTWECYAPSSKVTPADVLKAYLYYKDFEETATAVGMTKLELHSYILENPNLKFAINDYSNIK